MPRERQALASPQAQSPHVDSAQGRTRSQPTASNAASWCGQPGSGGPDAPNGKGFIALLEAFRATGGTAPGEIMGRLLQEHHVGEAVSLAKLIHTGQAFGFEWRASLWIPMFQFDAADLSLKAGAQRVRAELPPLWSGWTLASWFAAPNERLDGHSAAEMIDLDLTAVISAAHGLKPADVPPPTIVRPMREVAASV